MSIINNPNNKPEILRIIENLHKNRKFGTPHMNPYRTESSEPTSHPVESPQGPISTKILSKLAESIKGAGKGVLVSTLMENLIPHGKSYKSLIENLIKAYNPGGNLYDTRYPATEPGYNFEDMIPHKQDD